jgi:hypothetical protein
MAGHMEKSAHFGRRGTNTIGTGNQTLNDTVGALILGLLSLLLFIALQRAHARNRALMNQIQQLTQRCTTPTKQ